MYEITDYTGIEVIRHTPVPPEAIMQEYLPTMFNNDKQHSINENTFARAFTRINSLKYKNGLFYTRSGKANEELLSRDIWESISDMGITTNVGNTTEKLLKAVKLCATVPELKADENIVPFANGDLNTKTWVFHEEQYSSTPYRFPIPFVFDEIKVTRNFNKWLKDLFEEDDRETIRQYLGYCLVPHTKSQKALFLVGEGGVGKSVLGVILKAILGDAMISVSNSQEFINDKFKLPELENRLVLYDDDLDSAALSKTGLYKKLITNTMDITADRKYGQPFKFAPKVKIISCCNEMMTSMYDKTTGFFRRLLPIKTKPKSKDFRQDKRFYDKVSAEAEGIVQWAVAGLKTLSENDWELYESDRSKTYLQQKADIDNHMPAYFESEFIRDPFGNVTYKEITDSYERWCEEEGNTPYSQRTLQNWFSDNAETLSIEYSRCIQRDDKKQRGYKGMRLRRPLPGFEKGKVIL